MEWKSVDEDAAGLPPAQLAGALVDARSCIERSVELGIASEQAATVCAGLFDYLGLVGMAACDLPAPR